MAGDVDQGIALVDDGRTELRQTVDDTVDGVLIARDEGGGQQDAVALPHLDVAVLTVGDSGQG